MKRGISPLIASILLIFIVVILAITLMVFYQGVVSDKIDDVSDDNNLLNYCNYGINLELSLVCEYGSQLSLKIRNSGEGELAGFKFLVVDSDGNSYSTDENITMSSFSLKRYFFEGGSNFDKVDQVIVTPKISTSSLVGECNPIELDINDIPICCLDMDGDGYDSCNPDDSPEDDGFIVDCDDSNPSGWHLWENVYLDEDFDGVYSMIPQDYCGPGPYYDSPTDEIPCHPEFDCDGHQRWEVLSYSPGLDCMDSLEANSDYRFEECLNWDVHDYLPCLAFNTPYRVYGGLDGITFLTVDEKCFDNIDNNCNGQKDVDELGNVCYPNCQNGEITSFILPCWCSGNFWDLRNLPPASCTYCCDNSCSFIECVNVEDPEEPGPD